MPTSIVASRAFMCLTGAAPPTVAVYEQGIIAVEAVGCAALGCDIDVIPSDVSGAAGYVTADRAGVTRAFTSTKVKEVIARRTIRLISYADLAPPPARPAAP